MLSFAIPFAITFYSVGIMVAVCNIALPPQIKRNEVTSRTLTRVANSITVFGFG